MISDDEIVTYAEVDARSNAVATALVDAGVEPGAVVGVFLPRGADLVVAAVAIAKCAAVYLPVDVAYPDQRVAYTFEDADARAVITSRDLAGRLPRHVRAIIAEDHRQAHGAHFVAKAVRPKDAAYVIYTSGTTGRPKGVVIEHAQLSNLVAFEVSRWSLGPADRTSLFAAAGFDASIFELWPSLVAGATICVPSDETRRDPERLREWILARRLTVAFVTTPVVELLLGMEWPKDIALRHLLTGGDRLVGRPTPDLPFTLWNCYGPTECTVVSNVGPVAPHGPSTPDIGPVVDGAIVHVVDRDLQLVPDGEVGELCIGGRCVGRGYLARPALTAERFVPDPFSGEPGARMYRSGDLGRRLPDGTYECLGRIDAQLKIRGYRIEIGEIESAIAASPSVRAAVVTAHGTGAALRLVAHVVPHDDSFRVADLEAALARELPEYMVPSAFVVMSALPLTANGKVDRTALPAPPPEARAAWVAPANDDERDVAAAYAKALGVERVSANDDFFALGGHSLLAAKIASLLLHERGIRVSVRDVFTNRTPRALAEVIARGAKPETEQAIPRVDRGARLPVTSQEARLLFIHQMDRDAPTYNECGALRVEGEVDARALERALARLEERHEALRTRYGIDEAGSAHRSIDPPAAAPLEQLAAKDDADAEDRIRAFARRPFDLANARPWRAALVRVAHAHVIALAMHHVVSDQWSLHLVFRDLAELYRSERDGTSRAALAERSIDYADWAAHASSAGDRGEDVAYFARRLADVEPIALPTDRPYPPRQSFEGKKLRFTIEKGLRDRLRAIAHAEGTTLSTVLLSIFATLAHRISGSARFAVTLPVAGREHRALEDVVGFFVNTVALDFDFGAPLTFRELVRRTNENVLDAQAHGSAAFDKVVAGVLRTRDSSRAPLAQIGFAPQPVDAAIAAFAGAPSSYLDVDVHVAKLELTLDAVEQSDRVDLFLGRATALFDDATIERLAARYLKLASSVAGCADEVLSRIPLLLDEERALLTRWNATAQPFDETPVPDRIALHAKRMPTALAADGPGGAITFAELEQRAGRIAAYLRARGIGRGDTVATWFPRTTEIIVAALAIMKAGAAYLPLDPAHPPERLAFIVKDARAKLVLSTPAVANAADIGADVVDLATAVAETRDATPVSLHPCDAAYVIYTSGTTGRPKGTIVEHRALSNLIAQHVGLFDIRPNDRGVYIAGQAFDAGIVELWPALAVGASVFVVPEDVRTFPRELVAWFREHAIVHTYVPMALLPAVLAEDWSGAHARFMLCGGEVMQRRPSPHHPFQLLNGYGPTEATVYVTAEYIEPGDTPITTVGSPTQNSAIHILDADLEPVPIGVFGEICIGGANVARGYVDAPAMTAERFVPDPFSPVAGARMYRTGDRGRWLSDGRIEFAGRSDHQVKIRGHRIELGEIESALRRVPGVRDAVVVVTGEGIDKRLVGYVATNGLDSAAAQEMLRASLPDYMVPGVFVTLERFPLTPNGKVDRRALPEPTFTSHRPFVAPRTPLEEETAAIWCEVLSLPRVGIHDDFFELGGHSLTATRLVTRLRQKLDVDLPIRAVFDAPTVERLAERILETQLTQLSEEELSGLSS